MKPTVTKYLSLALVVFSAALMAGCSKAARKARHQARADKYFDAGQYSRAEVEYLNAAKLDQNDSRAVSRLGLIYFEQGRLARAYPFLNRARELDPNNLSVRLKKGFLHLALGDVKAAREEAIAILDKDPKFPEAAWLLAETGKTPADANLVRQRLEKLVQQTGVTAWSEIAFGRLEHQAGNLPQAKARFTHATSLDPNLSTAHFALGFVEWNLNEITNADRSLKKAAELSLPRSTPRLAYADFKLKTGGVAEGKQLLTDITKHTPDYVPAWVALAELAGAQRQYDECAKLVNQIQARDPDNLPAFLLNARLKLTKGLEDPAMIDQGIAEYEKLAARFTGSPQLFFQLGLAHLARGDAAKALKNFNQAVSLNPDYDDALLEQAKLNIQRDEPDLAIASMTKRINRPPPLPAAYLVLAGAHAAKDDFDNAVSTCRDVEKLNPKNPEIPLLIGVLFQRQKKNAEARAEFNKALALSPNLLPAMEQLVALDVSEKQPDSALARVQAEIDKRPNYPQLRALRAQIFLTQTNLDQAESDLRKAIEVDPLYIRAYFMLANLYAGSHKNEQAIKELNELLKRKPDNTSALILIGMIHNEQKNYAEARAAYEKLLETQPKFQTSPTNAVTIIALNNLAYLYSEKFGLLDKAYEAARKARDLAPRDPAASDTLGWILFKRGDYSWALSLLQSSASQLGDNPEVLYHMGMTYYMMNDEARARNAFNRALAANKEFPGHDEARKRLALLSLDFNRGGAEVVSALEKRIAEQPDDPIALSHLAAIYEKQGSREKAVQFYEQVLKRNSNNPKLLIALARLHAEHNNSQKAIDLARDAYKLAPNDADVAHTLGRLLFASAQYKPALALLQSAQKQSANAELLYDLAWALYSVGQVAEAQTTMQEALASNPSFAHAPDAKRFLDLISLSGDPVKAAAAAALIRQTLNADSNNVPALAASADAAENRGQIDAAVEAWEKVLKRYPDFTPAIRKLAIHYSEAPGKEQRAYELAVKAREAAPKDNDISKALGIISYRRGDLQGAIRFLNPGTQEAAADGKTLFYLGMAQFRLKQLKESKSSLEKALAKNLPAQLADDARRTLAQIK